MTEEKFIQLKKAYLEAMTVDTDDGKKMLLLSRNLPQLHQRCIGIVKDQFSETSNLKILMQQLYGKIYTKIRLEDPRNLSNTVINLMVESDDIYVKLKIEYNSQLTMLNFFEATILNIKSTSYQIKNYIDIKKFLEGN